MAILWLNLLSPAAEDVAPDKDGHTTLRITAAGANDAILQAIELQ